MSGKYGEYMWKLKLALGPHMEEQSRSDLTGVVSILQTLLFRYNGRGFPLFLPVFMKVFNQNKSHIGCKWKRDNLITTLEK